LRSGIEGVGAGFKPAPTDSTAAMKTNFENHRRQSIRLREYDYRQAGAYFITIVAHDRSMLFGEITGGETRLNEFGRIVERS
jgi:hypothetical protein